MASFGRCPLNIDRWARVEPWLPTSSQQVLSYLTACGYEIPKERKTRKPTTNEESLEKLIGLYPADLVLPKILEARKLKKARGYLDDTYLGKDGRMHPIYALLPDTGRIASKAPNFQNIPQGYYSKVERDLALAIRSTIVPSAGCVLVELDWAAIEALLVGYFAEDPDYIRASRLGPHGYLASHVLGRPADLGWDDAKLMAYCGAFKKEHEDVYALAKKANYSHLYDQSAKNKAKDMGTTPEVAKSYTDILDRLFPKVLKWKMDTRMRAHLEGRLVNPFGYVRYFFEVFRQRKDGLWAIGKEGRECLAFLPQSTCAGMCREVILDLPETDWMWLLVPIHDALFLECREEKVDECVRLVWDLMVRPWPQLNGLSVAVEAKVGRSWGGMVPWHAGQPLAAV